MTSINLETYVQVFHNTTNITTNVLSYTRDQSLCTGIGTCTLRLADNSIIPDVWDIIKIVENTLTRGTYFISKVEISAQDGSITVTGQDGSKLLSDFFIDNEYEVAEGDTSDKWIKFILDEVGITYSMPRGSGITLSPATTIGLTTAYDAVVQLLQYSGWYMSFDGDNGLYVGSLTSGLHTPVIVNDSTIAQIQTHKSDQSLRNRAVVWGSTNPVTGENVFADYSTMTRWNYGASDLRAIVYSNPHINTNDEASKIAKMLLRYFARLDNVKEVTLLDSPVIPLGTYVYINSDYYSGRGTVTTLSVSMSDGGITTNLKLDEKCPRLYAFISDYTDYVYIGTDTLGVWRKELSGSVWEEFNAGLSGSNSYGVSDLYINNDVFAMVSYSGELLTRVGEDGEWTKFIPSGVFDVRTSGEVFSDELLAQACTIEHYNNHVYCGYTTSGVYPSGPRSFVIDVNPYTNTQSDFSQVYILASGATIPDYDNITINSIDTTDVYNMLTVTTSGMGTVIPSGAGGLEYGIAPATSSYIHTSMSQSQYSNTTMVTGIPSDTFLDDYDFQDYTRIICDTTVVTGGSDTGNIIAEHLDDENINVYYLAYDTTTGATNLTHVNFSVGGLPITTNVYPISNEILAGVDNEVERYCYLNKQAASSIVNFVHLEEFQRHTWSTNPSFITKYDIDTSGAGLVLTTQLRSYTDSIYYMGSAINGNKFYILYATRLIKTDSFKMDVFDLQTGDYYTAMIIDFEWTDSVKYTPHIAVKSPSQYADGTLFPKPDSGVMFGFMVYNNVSGGQSSLYYVYGSDTAGAQIFRIEQEEMGDNIYVRYTKLFVSKLTYDQNYISLLAQVIYQPAFGKPNRIATIFFDSPGYKSWDLTNYTQYNDQDILDPTPIIGKYTDVYFFLSGSATTQYTLDWRDYRTGNLLKSVMYNSNVMPLVCADDIDDVIYIAKAGDDGEWFNFYGIDYNGVIVKNVKSLAINHSFGFGTFIKGRFIITVRNANVTDHLKKIVMQYIYMNNPIREREMVTYDILKQETDTYTVVWDTPVETYINCGPTTGTVVYSKNIPYSGTVTSGVVVEGYLATSLTDNVNEFTELLTVPSGICEARIFDYFFPTSGWVTPLSDRSGLYDAYVGIAGYGIATVVGSGGTSVVASGLAYSYIDLYNNEVGLIHDFAKNTVHLEATNYLTDQYIFTTTYDPVISGWEFWQKYPTASAFTAYSGEFWNYSALPDTNITIIRVDDTL